jgi:hypothetical protein
MALQVRHPLSYRSATPKHLVTLIDGANFVTCTGKVQCIIFVVFSGPFGSRKGKSQLTLIKFVSSFHLACNINVIKIIHFFTNKLITLHYNHFL